MRILAQIVLCFYIAICCDCGRINPWEKSFQWIRPGIERRQLEHLLGKLLAKDFHYNIYIHAPDTEALYVLDDGWKLKVHFKAGTSWSADRLVFPPIDSKVKCYELCRAKNKTMPEKHSTPEESIRAVLQRIYDDLYSIKIPEFRNLQPSCLNNSTLFYENGQRTIDKEYSRAGHVDYSYSENYCHLKVCVEYPTAYDITTSLKENGIPEFFGEVQGKPFAVWVELTEATYLPVNEVLETIVDIRLDEMRKEIGFKGSGFIANLKKYLASNATAVKITTINPKGLEPDRSYVIQGSASRDSIAAILRFISEDTTSTKASYQTRILQPAYSPGKLVFLKNGRKLLDIGMYYEVLSGREIGTIECTYHNRKYLQLLTKEGNEYFY